MYNRKPHVFSEQDVVRVFLAVATRDGDDFLLSRSADLFALLVKTAFRAFWRLFPDTFISRAGQFILEILIAIVQTLQELIEDARDVIIKAILGLFSPSDFEPKKDD